MIYSRTNFYSRMFKYSTRPKRKYILSSLCYKSWLCCNPWFASEIRDFTETYQLNSFAGDHALLCIYVSSMRTTQNCFVYVCNLTEDRPDLYKVLRKVPKFSCYLHPNLF